MTKNYVLNSENDDINVLMIVCVSGTAAARGILEEIEKVISPFPWTPSMLSGYTAYDYQHHFIGVKNAYRNNTERIMDILTESELVKRYVETGYVVLCTAPEFDDIWNKHKF